MDTTYADRFGPLNRDLIVAKLMDSASGARIGQAFFFLCGDPIQRFSNLGLSVFAEPSAPGEWRVTVHARTFAQAVAFDARGFVADDDSFHIEPGGDRIITLRGSVRTCRLAGAPLNGTSPISVIVRTAFKPVTS